MHKHSMSKAGLKQSTLRRGTTGYMSPRGRQKRTARTGNRLLLLRLPDADHGRTDFERVLTRIHAREYPGEGKGEGVDILKSQRPRNYLQADDRRRQKRSDPETRDAALRLEEKLNNYPDFKRAVEDSFLVSSGQEPRAAQAWQSLATNPYLQSSKLGRHD